MYSALTAICRPRKNWNNPENVANFYVHLVMSCPYIFSTCVFVLCSERYEALIDKDIGCDDINVTGHHQSRDSAIDTEVQECEMEICEIDLVINL